MSSSSINRCRLSVGQSFSGKVLGEDGHDRYVKALTKAANGRTDCLLGVRKYLEDNGLVSGTMVTVTLTTNGYSHVVDAAPRLADRAKVRRRGSYANADRTAWSPGRLDSGVAKAVLTAAATAEPDVAIAAEPDVAVA